MVFSKPRRLLAQAKQLKSGRHVPKTAFSWLGIGPQLKLGSVRRHQRKERHHHAETLGFSRVGIFLFFVVVVAMIVLFLLLLLLLSSLALIAGDGV